MGMAASQARLLSLTSRMADNELRAQIANNAKMRLAADSSRISADYVNALNNATMMITNYNEAGDSQFNKLTFNRLTQYSAFNTQYGLANTYGQLLVNENEAAIFEAAGGSLKKYLEAHGLKFTTSYFDADSFNGTESIEFKDEMGKTLGEFSLDDLKALYFGDGGVHLGYDANIEAYETYLSQISSFSMHYQQAQNNDKIMGLVDAAIVNGVNSITRLEGEKYTFHGASNRYDAYHQIPVDSSMVVYDNTQNSIQAVLKSIYNISQSGETALGGYNESYVPGATTRLWDSVVDQYLVKDDNGQAKIDAQGNFVLKDLAEYKINQVQYNGKTYYGDFTGGLSQTLKEYNQQHDTEWGGLGTLTSKESSKIGSKPCSTYNDFNVKIEKEVNGQKVTKTFGINDMVIISVDTGMPISKDARWGYSTQNISMQNATLPPGSVALIADGEDLYMVYPQSSSDDDVSRLGVAYDGKYFRDMWATGQHHVFGELWNTLGRLEQIHTGANCDTSFMSTGDFIGMGSGNAARLYADTNTLHELDSYVLYKVSDPNATYTDGNIKAYIENHKQKKWKGWSIVSEDDNDFWKTGFVFSPTNRRSDIDPSASELEVTLNNTIKEKAEKLEASFKKLFGYADSDGYHDGALGHDSRVQNMCGNYDDLSREEFKAFVNEHKDDEDKTIYNELMNYKKILTEIHTIRESIGETGDGNKMHTFQYKEILDENNNKIKMFTVDGDKATDTVHAWILSDDGKIRDTELYTDTDSVWRAILEDITEFAFGHAAYKEGYGDSAVTVPETKGQFRYSVNLMSYINNPSLDNDPEIKNLRAIRDKIYDTYGVNLSTTPATDFTYIGSYIDTLRAATQDADPRKARNAQAVYDSYILDCLFDVYGEPNVTWIDKSNPTGDAEAKVKWYTNLFERMKRGYKVLEDGLANSNEWIEYALESGVAVIEQVDKANNWNGTVYSNVATITEVTDDVAVARAEAEYKKAMNEIENKDKRLDIELKNIDTEHNALQTEYESVKSVISKNVERSFKMYNA